MKKHLLAACSLAAAAGLAAIAPMSANAASDGLQDGISVRITSDKADYSVGEDVNLSVSVENTNSFDVNDIDVKLLLPDELEFKLNEAPEGKIDLKAGEKVGYSAIAVKAEKTEITTEAAPEAETQAETESSTVSTAAAEQAVSEASTEQTASTTAAVQPASTASAAPASESSPRTGSKGVTETAVTLVLSASLALYLGKKGKINRKTFSFILSLMLVSSAMPYDAFVSAAADDLITSSISVDTTITSGSKPLSIGASVSYSFEKSELAKAADDTDGDGLTNANELLFGTDPSKADTDSDGLTDGFEVLKLASDPLSADSDGNSVSDFNEDEDSDGLTNGKEQELGTNPLKADSDGDELSDSDEVSKYNTDPNKPDTDDDGLIDSDEIKLSLDPTKSSTDGTVPDAEKKIAQTISDSAKSEYLLASDNVFRPAVSGSVAGLIDRKVALDKDETTSFADNRSVLSDVIEFTSKNHEPVTLTFTYDATVTGDTSSFAIFCFNNEELTTLETTVDKDKRTISAEIKDDAFYFVADLDGFLSGYGIDALAENGEVVLPTVRSSVKSADAEAYDFDALKAAAAVDTVGAGSTGDWILLSDYSVVQLKSSISSISSNDSDSDGLKDSQEIYNKREVSLTSSIIDLLKKKGASESWYKNRSTITMWDFYSNPALPDTDFDGIDDNKDSVKKQNSSNTSNVFKGYYHWSQDGENRKTEKKVEFRLDYRNLLSGNTSYKKDLSVFGILGASDAYRDVYVDWTDGITGGSDTAGDFLRRFGCKDVTDYNITSSNGYDTDDVTEVIIGHRNVVTADGSTEVVIVEVRGTNGTNAEWSSNFDVGANTSNYTSLTGSHPEWTNKLNHKGFDVTANRAQAKIESYLRARGITKGSIFICGHSRGAAIADILGAKFEDNANFLSYTYAFATPNSTTSSTAGNYRTIFNIVNSDDLVPNLPLEYWGFRKYGTTKTISVADRYEDSSPFGDRTNSWEWLIGKDYDDINSSIFSGTLSSFKKVASSRSQLYTFNSSDSDAKIWEDDLGHITKKGAKEELSELAATLKNEKLYKYCRLSIVGSWIYHVEVFYCPAYLLQVLANMTTGVGPMLGRDTAGKYATAKTYFVAASGKVPLVGWTTGGMQDTHEPVTYYLIANNNFQSIS